MATRQKSTNGKPKSPRIQVVLPEILFEQLASLADEESRTVSNMAKVLIQKGIEKYFSSNGKPLLEQSNTDNFRDKLEKQSIPRLKGAPKRIRYFNQTND